MLSRKKLDPRIIMAFIWSALLVFSPPCAQQTAAAYLGGELSTRYVVNLKEGDSYDAFSSLELELESRFGPVDLYLNPVLTFNFQQSAGDAFLKEAYLDFYFADFDLRVGKQLVTWGKADGMVLTNMVNPLDLTEYPVVDFADQFQSINAVKIDYYLSSKLLEIIWVPEFEPAKMDPALLQKHPAATIPPPPKDLSRKEMKSSLENSEIALKYSSLGQGYDYELVAGYFWDDEPTMHLEEKNGNLVMVPEHHRLTMVGGSLSTALGPFVVRIEGAYLNGKYFGASDPLASDGTLQKDQVKFLLAGDYALGDYLLSLQVMEEIILDYEQGINKEEYTELVSLLISRSFLRETLSTEVTFYYDQAHEQLLVRPRIGYDLSDQVNFKGGACYALDGGVRDDVLFLQINYLF